MSTQTRPVSDIFDENSIINSTNETVSLIAPDTSVQDLAALLPLQSIQNFVADAQPIVTEKAGKAWTFGLTIPAQDYLKYCAIALLASFAIHAIVLFSSVALFVANCAIAVTALMVVVQLGSKLSSKVAEAISVEK